MPKLINTRECSSWRYWIEGLNTATGCEDKDLETIISLDNLNLDELYINPLQAVNWDLDIVKGFNQTDKSGGTSSDKK